MQVNKLPLPNIGDVSAVDSHLMRVCEEKDGKTAPELNLPQKRPQKLYDDD